MQHYEENYMDAALRTDTVVQLAHDFEVRESSSLTLERWVHGHKLLEVTDVRDPQ